MPKLREELEAVLGFSQRSSLMQGLCFIPRKNFYYGKWVQGGGWYPDYQLRFFKRGVGAYGEVEVHPRFDMTGSIGYFRSSNGTFDVFSITRCNDRSWIISESSLFTISLAANERRKVQGKGRYVTVLDLFGSIPCIYLCEEISGLKQGFRDGIRGVIYCQWVCEYVYIWEICEIVGT